MARVARTALTPPPREASLPATGGPAKLQPVTCELGRGAPGPERSAGYDHGVAFKDLFSFLFQRSTGEERVAQYVIREHGRGRALAEILEDKYVVNRLPSPQQRARLLDRPEVLHVVGSDSAEAAKAVVTEAPG